MTIEQIHQTIDPDALLALLDPDLDINADIDQYPDREPDAAEAIFTASARPSLRWLVWNAKTNRNPDTVVDTIETLLLRHDADVAIINEAETYIPLMRRRLVGYRVFTGPAPRTRQDKEDRSTAILVRRRRGITTKLTNLLRTRIRWRGPKGGLHWGRTFPVVDIRKDGINWRIIGVHRVPGGPTMHDAEWAAEDRRLRRYCTNRGSRARALLVGGDQNTLPTNSHRLGTRSLARRIGGRIVPGHKVDHLIVRSCRVLVNVGAKHGSDHYLLYGVAYPV